MAYLKMSDVNLTNKRVLIREDLNIPLKNGKITSDVRIKAA
ncbi:MAG: phosphoglycerate kinase, partial [Gammaproteobacteria bacterium]|nr:phosphoglycerate kinase [Gammaproteobacteria bacterium]